MYGNTNERRGVADLYFPHSMVPVRKGRTLTTGIPYYTNTLTNSDAEAAIRTRLLMSSPIKRRFLLSDGPEDAGRNTIIVVYIVVERMR